MTLLVVALTVAQPPDPFDGLAPDLVREITGWKKGTPPPGRLLRFPNGPPCMPSHCDLPVVGEAVGHYIRCIGDDELVKALLFDPRADAACVRAAARRLVELRSVKEVRALIAARRKTDPGLFTGAELATFTQLLASPYAQIQVAFVNKKDAPKEEAERALSRLKADLTAGVPWKKAYGATADLLFDKERSRKEGGGWRTFLCYRYGGLISPTGFDLLDRRISDELDPRHIRKLFEAKGGVHRLETERGYWLYYVEAFYD
jgi:hypothetical protein